MWYIFHAAGGSRRRAKMLQLDHVGLRRQTAERGNVLLDHFADRIAQEAPIHHVVDRHPHVDQMSGAAVLRDVQSEIGNAAGDAGGTGALALVRAPSTALQ